MAQVSKVTVGDLTPLLLRERQVWADLVETMGSVFEYNVENPIRQQERLRFLNSETDNFTLTETCRMLGFDISQDVLDFNTSKLLRIVTQLARYQDHNGTQLFSNFLDMLLNAQTNVVYLWTNDYKNFYDRAHGPLVVDGGDWYSVTHVEVVMAFFIDNAVLQNVVLNAGSSVTFYQRVKKLFYLFAPITLVIERFYFAYVERMSIGFAIKLDPKYTKQVVIGEWA